MKEDKFISFEEITERARDEIAKGFKGKAVIGFVDLLGFTQKIRTQWDDKDNDPLELLMKMKVYFNLAVEKTNNEITLQDYEGEKLRVIEYPEIITVSDSFMFLKPIDNSSQENNLLSIFSVIAASLELWRIAIDNGFSIRGGIDFGDIFYHKLDIVGEPFIDAYNLESNVADTSRIILSHNIRNLIKDNLDNIHPIILHYFQRYLNKEDDGFLSVNPLMILGHNAEALENTMNKLNEMLDGIENEKILDKYKSLIDILKAQDMTLNELSIFDD